MVRVKGKGSVRVRIRTLRVRVLWIHWTDRVSNEEVFEGDKASLSELRGRQMRFLGHVLQISARETSF